MVANSLFGQTKCWFTYHTYLEEQTGIRKSVYDDSSA